MDQTECTHQTHEESDEGSQICQGDAWHIAVGNFTLEGLEDDVELFLVAGTASTTNLGQWHAAAWKLHYGTLGSVWNAIPGSQSSGLKFGPQINTMFASSQVQEALVGCNIQQKGRRNQFEHDLGMEMGTTTYLAFPCSVLQIWFKYLILPELCPMRIEENRRKLISRA